jgi:hypothetical protein
VHFSTLLDLVCEKRGRGMEEEGKWRKEEEEEEEERVILIKYLDYGEDLESSDSSGDEGPLGDNKFSIPSPRKTITTKEKDKGKENKDEPKAKTGFSPSTCLLSLCYLI